MPSFFLCIKEVLKGWLKKKTVIIVVICQLYYSWPKKKELLRITINTLCFLLAIQFLTNENRVPN